MVARVYVLILIPPLLAACGGGGSSNENSASGTVTGTVTVPNQAPPLPQPIYTGNQSAATVNEADAPQIALDFFWATYLSSNLGASAVGIYSDFIGQQTVNTVVTGPDGGSASIIGRQSYDSAWYEIVFSNYTYTDSTNQASVSENGTVVIFVSPPTIAGDSPTYTIGFDQYQSEELSSDVSLQGSITEINGGDPTAVLSNLIITEVKTGSAVYLSDLNQASGANGVTYTGRLYDSSAGYVQVATPTPIPGFSCVLDVPDNPSLCYPFSVSAPPEGDLTFSGNGLPVLHLSVLDNDYLFLGLDQDGNGTIDEGTRFDEVTGTIDQGGQGGIVNTAPIAHIVQTNTAQVGTSVQLDGKFSYVSGGWVTYSWQMLQAPPGSQVVFQDSKTSDAEFTPDVAGHYLVGLTVSANNVIATSLLQVWAESNGSTIGDSGPSSFALPSSEAGIIVGQTAVLDGAASPPGGVIGAVPQWVMTTPVGSRAVLGNTKSLFPSLVPDIPGYYEIAANDPSNPFAPMVLNRMIVAVGAKSYLSPAVPFNDDVQDSYGLVCGSLDHSGRPGIAMVGSAPNVANTITNVWLWTRNASSAYTFNAPVQLSNGQQMDFALLDGQVGGLDLQDFNGDGQDDIVAADAGGATVYNPNASGNYSAITLTLPSGENIGMDAGTLSSASASNSQSVVIVSGSPAGTSLYTYVWNGSGFNAPVVTPNVVPTYSQSLLFALGDVTGDGNADAVFCLVTGSGAELLVEPGNGAGGFGAPASYPLPGPTCGALKVAALTGSGLQDIVVADGTNLNVFMQTATGTLQAQPALSMGSGASGMAIADLNGDGYPDIAVLPAPCSDEVCNQKVGIFWGSPSGPVGPEFIEDVGAMYPNTTGGGQMVACDLNGDGVEDLVINFDGTVYVMYGEPVN